MTEWWSPLPMSQADTRPDSAADAYSRLVSAAQQQAESMDGDRFTVRAKRAADSVVKAAVGHGDETAFLLSVLTQTHRGPHESWESHDFDTSDPDGALRALAASAIASDVIGG